MRTKYFSFAFLLIILLSIKVDYVSSYLIDKEPTTGSFTANSNELDICTETDDEDDDDDNDDAEPKVSLYLNSNKTKVGFTANNVLDYDKLEYKITYFHKTEFGTINEMVQGTIDNSLNQNEIKEEWIVLGSCSSGGTCVYQTGIEDINLEVKLFNSNILLETLNDSISF